MLEPEPRFPYAIDLIALIVYVNKVILPFYPHPHPTYPLSLNRHTLPEYLLPPRVIKYLPSVSLSPHLPNPLPPIRHVNRFENCQHCFSSSCYAFSTGANQPTASARKSISARCTNTTAQLHKLTRVIWSRTIIE